MYASRRFTKYEPEEWIIPLSSTRLIFLIKLKLFPVNFGRMTILPSNIMPKKIDLMKAREVVFTYKMYLLAKKG